MTMKRKEDTGISKNNNTNHDNTKRASETALAGLHGLFAQHLLNRLKSGEVTTQELNTIRQFLKDNGIECIRKMNSTIMDITAHLPNFNEENSGSVNAEGLM